jgi:hypothetical protein
MIALWLITTPPQVMAAECFAGSPAKNRGLPLTAEIEIKNITDDEHQTLTRFIKNLEGFWKGTATEINCKGATSAPMEEKHDYKVDVHATSKYLPVEDALSLKFRATWDGKTRNTSKMENFRFFLTPQRLRLDRNIPAGDVATIKVAENFLVFTKMTHMRNAAGGVVAQEIVRSFQLAHRTLTIEYLVYSNGMLAAKSQWELRR